MAYNPVNPNGQAPGANSAPVVLASDTPIILDDVLAVLNEIQVAVSSLQNAKGVQADLRVTGTGYGVMPVSQATATSLQTNVGSVGSLSLSLNPMPAAWQNQTSQQAFTLNVTRS